MFALKSNVHCSHLTYKSYVQADNSAQVAYKRSPLSKYLINKPAYQHCDLSKAQSAFLYPLHIQNADNALIGSLVDLTQHRLAFPDHRLPQWHEEYVQLAPQTKHALFY